MNIKAILLKPVKFFLLFRALKEAFDPQPLDEVRQEALYQAEHDLHKAELTTERAVFERDMLKARVKRIKAEMDAPRRAAQWDGSHAHTGAPGISLTVTGDVTVGGGIMHPVGVSEAGFDHPGRDRLQP